MKYDYGVIAIGSGSGGGAAAFVARRCNVKVAIVEARRDMLGGHCPNYACVPTKALLKAGRIYELVQRAGEFGIKADNPGFDFAKVAAYRDEIVDKLTGPRIERNLANAGIDLLWGEAKFVSDQEIEVADQRKGTSKRYAAQHVIVATGSKEFIPPIPGLAETGFWVSDDAVKLTRLPKSIIIIGAGPVGTEFAQIFSVFGVKVYLLQRPGQILQREDPEIAGVVQGQLAEQGVEVVLGMEVLEVHKDGSEKIVKVKIGGKQREFKAEEIMVATGRRANLENLNLEAAGVKTDERGKLILDEYLKTTAPHIYAAGDAAGNWQFTHTASYEGDLVGRNLCLGQNETTDYAVVPRVTFCEPEVASVGLTEEQARDEGKDIVVAKFKPAGLGRFLIEHKTKGLLKIVADKKTKQIYGGHIVGENAGQLIHEIALAQKAKIPATEIGRMIHAYPTFSEAVAAAAEQFLE